ncbi:hypothetical protein [Aeromonas hydrophila]|uniref:hypothetical protein n=1 Tax=Aeromonas hydrophila TaxID=644 RepID=UPI002B45D155|nr:hypothetical protein [Aeromonas hydrophila]
MNSYIPAISKEQLPNKVISQSFTSGLMLLPVNIRNKIRSLHSAEAKIAKKTIENLRKTLPFQQLAQVEKTLRLKGHDGKYILPSLFPSTPQIKEGCIRLEKIDIELQLKIINWLCKEYHNELYPLISSMSSLSNHLIKLDLVSVDNHIFEIISAYGYSHFIMRKAALAYINNIDKIELPNIEKLFNLARLGENNIITSSLVQSYQEDQDFLSIKRSVLSIEDRGDYNKYTRDILRTTFHCHAKSIDEASDFIQSNLQSSLIDALLTIKINSNIIPSLSLHTEITKLINHLEESHPNIADISASYLLKIIPNSDHDPEHIFYKQSSAWLECDEIIKYRFLLDNYYDDPSSLYLNRDVEYFISLTSNIDTNNLESLSDEKNFHLCNNINQLQNAGTITRTALFNLILSTTSGNCSVSEESLFKLMHTTSELDKTAQVSDLKNLSFHNISDESTVIINLLVSKRSKDEFDKFYLRRKLQEIVIKRFQCDLIKYINFINSKSTNVANYMYELFTEDYISRLSKVITETSGITETRAALHSWMGNKTGDKSYTDRARTILIDHQINKIRNEIDDHRIYVDMGRFNDWINDELVRDISSILTSMSHKKTLTTAYTDVQLLNLIDKAFYNFCSNNIFGIASYLGRRIRHGTFKGHLYTSVVQIENEYIKRLSQSPSLLSKWANWKVQYENKIDKIIIDILHIESSSKRFGFLKPNIRNPVKLEIAASCAQTLANDFEVNSHKAISITTIISEYCWRLAEVDLRDFNKYLKKNRFNVQDFIHDFKLTAGEENQRSYILAIEFTRDLQQCITKKIDAMIGWFKRPTSVSPKASVSLLYKAVVEEVKESLPSLSADTEYSEEQDIELMGGAYHVIYDALYVVIYNAAKHGRRGGNVCKNVYLLNDQHGKTTLKIHISSQVCVGSSDDEINRKLEISSDDDIINAQLSESRSGIRKLHNLQQTDPNFKMEKYNCLDGYVEAILCYDLVH